MGAFVIVKASTLKKLRQEVADLGHKIDQVLDAVERAPRIEFTIGPVVEQK